MNFKKLIEAGGWLGIILIQGATLPTTLARIIHGTGTLPPLSMVLMVWAGLILFLIRAIERKDVLYIASNAFGFAMNSILLALIIFRG